MCCYHRRTCYYRKLTGLCLIVLSSIGSHFNFRDFLDSLILPTAAIPSLVSLWRSLQDEWLTAGVCLSNWRSCQVQQGAEPGECPHTHGAIHAERGHWVSQQSQVDPALRMVLITNVHLCQLQNSTHSPVHPTFVNNTILLWEGCFDDQQPIHFCMHFICSFTFRDTCKGKLLG